MKKFFNTTTYMTSAILLALLTGYLDQPFLYGIATTVSDVFMKLLKLVSVPIIFLSIISTVSGMDGLQEFKSLGKRVVKYTLLTTLTASALALALFLIIKPVNGVLPSASMAAAETDQTGYMTYLLQAIPSNFLQPFVDHHVIGVLFLAIAFSLATLSLPASNRTILHGFFSSLYAVVMKVTTWIIMWIPLAIWSFIALFLKDIRAGLELESLALYLTCVVLANLIQGLVVLPIFAKSKGVSPLKLAKGMLPALSLAFFTKSSSATLPTAMRCAEENLGIPRKITSFSFPLCTTINMNGCAAFILTTVLFVSMSNGFTYTLPEMVLWVFIATLAAVGNAGVPMGCFFLSSAFLATMNVPLNLLGVILPFYALIDMLETVINVWSDSCVVAIVNQEVNEENLNSNLVQTS